MSGSLADRVVTALGTDPGTVTSLVVEYYRSFTGRWFDRIADATNPNAFVPADLYACSTLSAPIASSAGVKILEDEQVQSLLAMVPPDVSIRDPRAVELLDDEMPLAHAYWRLRALPSVGRTRASKLLAVKRPALIPIRDSVVESYVGMAKAQAWWSPWAQAWADSRLGDAVDELRRLGNGGIPGTVTDARLLDVALWRLAPR